MGYSARDITRVMAIRILLLDPTFHVLDNELFLVPACNITADINRIHLLLGDGCCSLRACKFDDPFIVMFPMRNEALRSTFEPQSTICTF